MEKEPVDLKKLQDNLNEVVKKFREFRDSGINEEMLLIYIADKTKLPKKEIKNMLDKEKEFYDVLIKDKVLSEF